MEQRIGHDIDQAHVDRAKLETGVRIIVDRMWVRGVSKERARINEWRNDVALSTSLYKWFSYETVSACRFDRERNSTKRDTP